MAQVTFIVALALEYFACYVQSGRMCKDGITLKFFGQNRFQRDNFGRISFINQNEKQIQPHKITDPKSIHISVRVLKLCS